MKTKIYFISDVCAKINTYRNPCISKRELELLDEYSEALKDFMPQTDNNIVLNNKIEFLEDELIKALICLEQDESFKALDSYLKEAREILISLGDFLTNLRS